MTLRLHRAALLLALWCGTGWLLLRLGGGALDVPFGSAEHLAGWLEAADPAIVAAAVLRLAGMALCGYLVAVTALALLAAVARGRSSAAISAERLMPTMLRRMLLRTAGAGVTSAVISSAVSPALVAAAPDQGEHTADRTAVMVKLEPLTSDETGQASASTTRPAEEPGTTATTTVPSTTSTTPSVAPATTPDPRDADSDAQGAADKDTDATDTSSDTWMVQAGDSFWSISEEIVAERLASQGASSPTEADIARYWRVLIGANRDRLADRANPDLLFPGQELSLPRSQWGTPTAR